MRLLLISNGNGEDRIAIELARVWHKLRPGTEIKALALVGTGQFYQDVGIALLRPGFSPPSQGFAYLHPKLLWKDLQAGLLPHLWQSLNLLKAQQNQLDYVLAVGDIVPLIAALQTRTPASFVACALSDYYCAHPTQSSFDPLQRQVLKRFQVHTFARDMRTAQNLQTRGIQAFFLGNPMLDAFDKPGDEAPHQATTAETTQAPCIGILPGSHRDAKANLKLILKQIHPLENTPLRLAVIMAPQISPQDLVTFLQQQGWKNKSPATNTHWQRGELRLKLSEHSAFQTVLKQAALMIGLAGTANEQAVAHGVPVLSFAGHGQQYTWAFGEAQQRLLGAGLVFLGDPHPQLVCWQIRQMLKHLPSYRQICSEVGRERFGLPGASDRIVQHILSAIGA